MKIGESSFKKYQKYQHKDHEFVSKKKNLNKSTIVKSEKQKVLNINSNSNNVNNLNNLNLYLQNIPKIYHTIKPIFAQNISKTEIKSSDTFLNEYKTKENNQVNIFNTTSDENERNARNNKQIESCNCGLKRSLQEIPNKIQKNIPDSKYKLKLEIETKAKLIEKLEEENITLVSKCEYLTSENAKISSAFKNKLNNNKEPWFIATKKETGVLNPNVFSQSKPTEKNELSKLRKRHSMEIRAIERQALKEREAYVKRIEVEKNEAQKRLIDEEKNKIEKHYEKVIKKLKEDLMNEYENKFHLVEEKHKNDLYELSKDYELRMLAQKEKQAESDKNQLNLIELYNQTSERKCIEIEEYYKDKIISLEKRIQEKEESEKELIEKNRNYEIERNLLIEDCQVKINEIDNINIKTKEDSKIQQEFIRKEYEIKIDDLKTTHLNEIMSLKQMINDLEVKYWKMNEKHNIIEKTLNEMNCDQKEKESVRVSDRSEDLIELNILRQERAQFTEKISDLEMIMSKTIKGHEGEVTRLKELHLNEISNIETKIENIITRKQQIINKLQEDLSLKEMEIKTFKEKSIDKHKI